MEADISINIYPRIKYSSQLRAWNVEYTMVLQVIVALYVIVVYINMEPKHEQKISYILFGEVRPGRKNKIENYKDD